MSDATDPRGSPITVGRRGRPVTASPVTARGPVTFRRAVLPRLGIQPGARIRLERPPDRRAEPKAGPAECARRRSHGMLAGKADDVRCVIAGIGDAIARAGAEARMSGLGKP